MKLHSDLYTGAAAPKHPPPHTHLFVNNTFEKYPKSSLLCAFSESGLFLSVTACKSCCHYLQNTYRNVCPFSIIHILF